MKSYEYIQDFKIKYCEVDFKDEIKLSTALALMEEVACASADELNFGYAFLKERGFAFMVANIYLELTRPICLGEVVRVKTWPSVPSRATFEREYQFETVDGETLVNATSRWCLVDIKAGKLLPSKAIDNQDYSTYNTAKLFEKTNWKIPSFQPEEGELGFQLTIANSEYDHNMHVNNTRYAEYCLNCFSIAELDARKLKKFSISYLKQGKEGNILRFYRKKTEEGGYLVHGFNENDEAVVQSYLYFEE